MEFLQNMPPFLQQLFIQILFVAPVILIALTIHEVSHGYVALLLGDRTAKNMGRLTLNPIKHIDWLGFLAFLIAHIGWAKPVPVDMRYFKDPKRGMAITALAGPVSNIVLAFVSEFALYILKIKFGTNLNEYVQLYLVLLVQYNCLLAMFNFLPIPPLDGSKILGAFLPNKAYYTLMMYEKYGMILLIILAYTNIFDISSLLMNGTKNLTTVIDSIIQLIPM